MRVAGSAITDTSARAGAAREGRAETLGWGQEWLATLLAPFAHPFFAGFLALIGYLFRGSLNKTGFERTEYSYFNDLAEAFLHGKLSLLTTPPLVHDLVIYQNRYYLYWPPFPAVVLMPVVALFGVAASDIVYTSVFGAITVGLTAKLLAVLDSTGVAPLSVIHRALLVISVGFGSVVFILAPVGTVWFTAQLIGWGFVLLATIAGLALPNRRGYFLTGLALGCALTTRNALVFNGIWLAYFMLRRDWSAPMRERLVRIACGLAPVVAAVGALGWYNWARFGSLTETGLQWHSVANYFKADFDKYGIFNLHYLPINLRYQFWTYPVFQPLAKQDWNGGSLFWMTPVLLAAPWALVRHARNALVWWLALSCLIVYIPIGLLMGTGWVTYGPRYLLDLMVPILVLAAIGLRRWPVGLVFALAAISCAGYIIGSRYWMLTY